MSEDQSGVVTLKVRVTPEFREKIIETAKANNRSMNAEIVHRLERSFDNPPLTIGDLIEASHTKPRSSREKNPVASDPRERRRLAKLAAESALQNMSAADLVDTLFNKLNSEGSRLTVEEIKRDEEPQEQSEIDLTNKAP